MNCFESAYDLALLSVDRIQNMQGGK